LSLTNISVSVPIKGNHTQVYTIMGGLNT